ncbi:MAG: DUF6263 family protein [bacterium]|nr:DUF6263 family protein [bacterium]
MRRLLKIFLFTFIIFIFTSCVKEKYDLSLNLEPGSIYSVEYKVESKFIQNIRGVHNEMNEEMEFKYKYTILSKVENKFKLRVVLEEFKVKRQSPNMSHEFTSESERTNLPPGSEILFSFLNKEIEMLIDRTGEVSEITGFEKINEELLETIKEKIKELPKEQQEQALSGFEKNLENNDMKERLSYTWNIYPDKPIALKEKYQIKYTTKGIIPLEIENNFELGEIKSDQYKLYINSNIKTISDKPAIDNASAQIYYDLQGTQMGYYYLDSKTRMITESQTEQKLEGEMKIKGAGYAVIPIVNETKIRVQIEKL